VTAAAPTTALAARRHGVFHPLVVSALDRLTEDAVAVTFALVATLACLLPSLRASRIDPIIALRAD